MIVWLAERMADALIQSGAVKQDDRDIYVYGMDVLLSTASSIVCILVLGILLGRIPDTLLFLAFFTVLRGVAGGYHADTHLKCFTITFASYVVAVALVSAASPAICLWASLPVAALAMAAVAALAPAPHENRPVSAGELKKFRRLSIAFAIAETLLIGVCLALGAAVLAFSASLGMLTSAASLVAAHLAAHGKEKTGNV